MCEAYRAQYGCDFISVMPTNLYGPNDNYDLENSHVLPAMIRKFQEAKERGDASMTLWGTGSPMREFLHVDDMAAASVFVMQLDNSIYQQHTQPMLSHINIGSGTDVWRFSEAVRAGEMSLKEFMAAESGMSRSKGVCMTMGTASTLTSVAEVLGFTLPGAASIPATSILPISIMASKARLAAARYSPTRAQSSPYV